MIDAELPEKSRKALEAARVRQRRFLSRKKELGLKRVQLWVRPEDVAALRVAARQPGELASLREEAEARLISEISGRLEARLEGTGRALTVRIRAALSGNAMATEELRRCSAWLEEQSRGGGSGRGEAPPAKGEGTC